MSENCGDNNNMLMPADIVQCVGCIRGSTGFVKRSFSLATTTAALSLS